MGYSEIIRQAQLFALAVLTGAVLFFLYDLLRMFRRMIRHKIVAIVVQDVLFWMLCALWLFVFMYRQNDGIIRGFLIFGAFGGMCLYSVWFSRWVVRGGTVLFRCVFHVTGRFFYIISSPVRFFSVKMRRYLRKKECRNKKRTQYMKKRLKKLGKAVRIGVSRL